MMMNQISEPIKWLSIALLALGLQLWFIVALIVGGWLWVLPTFLAPMLCGILAGTQKQKSGERHKTAKPDSSLPKPKPSVIERSLSPMRSVMTEKELDRESWLRSHALAERNRDHLSTDQSPSPSRRSSAAVAPTEPRKRRKRLACIEFSYIDAEGQYSHRQVNVFAADTKHFEGYCLHARANRTFLVERVVGDVVDLETGEVFGAKTWAWEMEKEIG